ncbi:MAG: S46 family peptidase [Bacteroidales bacterium]|jgi:hypothetical protein|nr:S46 family peptidase [Bacteroidales bacterium]
MKRLLSVLLIISLTVSGFRAVADEGMWLLSMIGKNYEEMKEMGLKLSPEDIYSINQASLKDAIVGLGNEGAPFRHFCTGELISDKGLMLTNHHCGYGMIQQHSSVENDYLKDGFWAKSLDEELTNEGITASILVRMEDVTEQITKALNDTMTEAERNAKIRELSSKITEAAEKGTDYSAQVATMFDNNQFFLFVYTIYKDVRLVGAPPEDMGKFGGDTDNWSWPRHTADFSMFRVYTGPDGKPATYSEDNIPLKPKHHLPVSLKGIEKDDFAMILGFPGGTDRYMTSYGLKETMDITNNWRYEIRDVKLNAMREDMNADPKIKLQYASKYARSANYWKYSHEQNIALRKLNTMAQKQKLEKKYQAWADNIRTDKYRDVLSTIENAYESRKEEAYARQFLLEALLTGPDLTIFAFQATSFLRQLQNEDNTEEQKQAAVESMKTSAKEFYKDYNAGTEQKMLAALFTYFGENIDQKYYPEAYAEAHKKYKGDFNEWAEKMIEKEKTIFATEESMMDFLENPKAKKLEKDAMYEMAMSVLGKYREVAGEMNAKSEGLERARRLFVEGLMNIRSEQNWYPDANSTIRLTYGKVDGYVPRDAVYYEYLTSMEGILEKADPDSYEFDIPKRLKTLAEAKDYGQYADENGQLPVCFITDNDITGGNSGSPVINGEGHLIGTAFDGNGEAMSGDIEFEDNLQRCINLDVRYTLWIIDKFAGASNLIDEMTIIK